MAEGWCMYRGWSYLRSQLKAKQYYLILYYYLDSGILVVNHDNIIIIIIINRCIARVLL